MSFWGNSIANKLSNEKRAQILSMLCEGMGINAVTRITGVGKNAVLKLLADAGEACAKYQDEHMRNLKCKCVECDEIWSFVGMKQKNLPEELNGILGFGDVYTWTVIDADTKFIPCWHVGTRDTESAKALSVIWKTVTPTHHRRPHGIPRGSRRVFWT